MSDSWGGSWGTSWGGSWGSAARSNTSGVDAWGGSWGSAWGSAWTRSVAVVPPSGGNIGGTRKRRSLADRDRADDALVDEIERALTEPVAVEPPTVAAPPPDEVVPAQVEVGPLDPFTPALPAGGMTAMALAMQAAQAKLAAQLKEQDPEEEELLKMLLLLA